MRGKICVVTGSSSGIGLATAAELARRGATVLVTGHEEETTRTAFEQVRAASPTGEVEMEVADLATREGVDAFAAAAERRFDRIDVLHNNAGVLCHEHTLTRDGIELTWAVNYFAPFRLTHLLADRIAATGAGRVVNTASVAHRWGKIRLDRLHEARRFGVFHYFDTKLALVMFTQRMARELGPRVTVNCLHPGVIGTNLAVSGGVIGTLMRIGKPVMRRPQSGARTPVFLATEPGLAETTGQYFVGERVRRPSRRTRDEALGESLWQHSLEVMGVG